MNYEIVVKAKKIKQKKKIIKISKFIVLILLLLLLLSYCVVGIVYSSGTFSIRLDRDLYLNNGIIIYDDPNYKVFRTDLYVEPLEFMDNISYRWLPEDLHENEGGSHNGENYIAYTFFIENMGEVVTNYWAEIIIDNVFKNVDEAIRIRVYKNGEYETYAKIAADGNPEPGTIPFKTDEIIYLKETKNFRPGDLNKYTIVIWLEGSDPECTNNILGGEIQMHMAFNSETVREIEE